MKIDGGNWLAQKAKNSKPLPKELADKLASGGEDKFSSNALPHADFDTNRAKLLEKARREPGFDQIKKPDYSEPVSNRDVNQTGYMQQMIENLGPQFARMQYTQECSQLNGMIPTQSQLQAEFDKLASDPTVPFEYIKDGCYARAHDMCEQMHEDKVNCSKIFVMVENPYEGGRLTAENKYMQAKWWYHVAPLVWAVDSKSHNVVPFVMDPSMSKAPMTPEEWIHAMWDEKTKIKVDITHDKQFGPLESGGPNSTFEESLDDTEQVKAEYTKELEKIKEDYEKEHPPQEGGGAGQKAA
jgi:hypothetical protein